MNRYLIKHISKDLNKKIILLSGPRQVGKTTLSKSITKSFDYLDWDYSEDRLRLLKKDWNRAKELIIFDELHKMKNFKSWLKGIYDKEGIKPRLLVTGSSRLDIAKKMGDSLAGRFFPYRLYPLDLWELSKLGHLNLDRAYDKLISYSGFPEPYKEESKSFYSRWSKTHTDLILRQDLIDLTSIRDIPSIETLIMLLQERVGTSISSLSLANILQKDSKTIKNWLTVLENLYVIFKITPYNRNIARSLIKEPKYYFYDVAKVRGDEGVKLENLVALSIKKQLDYLSDTAGVFGVLYYIKTREGKEIDFCIDWEDKTQKQVLIEVKLSDTDLSPNFKFIKSALKNPKCVQLVKNYKETKICKDGEKIEPAIEWLGNMPILE